MKPIKRGEYYYADLSPSQGSEQGGRRPVVVIQNDVGNFYSPTVIVAVITSKPKKQLPTHIPLRADTSALPKDSIILLEQLRTIDKKRLGRYIGTLNPGTMQQLDHAMLVSLGLTEYQTRPLLDKRAVC